ncbi:para-hydroxybenzoate--polyprenyltransferase, mitochondrial precursor (PHB:polyprenyltransferase) [Aspergillus brasiliensis]|uniref:Para-hydroxybenzoate--polyprenyltransferase, mitochondrial (PHB:polyprenyltransferase) n=1 Tax=Aspergillus brasiliensis TaxID=319629 RepID=A0A9W5Z2J2_9EURO|nr:para-hydroxybenzoate--polyprenyltransferase, mitochondrial precursor (PHB:polyprenyltransferase) [Aspergillus brasiliensis]GKZ43565.1 para-hydroxybenzoate--polyprenyltransferase, mitochondrial precursor (PHB:polyprenyltransferase) [Aspergillus brasiliensis]
MASSTKTITGAMPPQANPQRGPPQHHDLPLSITNPSTWIPYIQLMRLERPAALIGYYMPSILGLVYAASLAGPAAVPPTQLLSHSGFFLVANIFIRGAACTWNDNIDQDYDRQVDRCRGRPIARGAVSTLQGHVFLSLQLATLVALMHPLPHPCGVYSVAMGALYALYPFCKRFTHYPQAILGVPLSLSIVISAYSLDVPEGNPFQDRQTTAATLALGGAEVLWTMIYDTIYAHQDLADDVRAGVKSMAVKFRHYTKPLCAILGVLQVGLLALAGIWTQMPLVYFALGVMGSAVALVVMIASVDLSVPSSCARWFKLGFCWVGGCMNVGFLAVYLVRWWIGE